MRHVEDVGQGHGEGVTFKPGDRVAVHDPALEQLQAIMRSATDEEPPPNNIGTVDEVDGDRVLINFDDGGCAPYPARDTRLLKADE